MKTLIPNQQAFVLVPLEEFETLIGKVNEIHDLLIQNKNLNKNILKESWIDNQEVMNLLKISPRTLQSMRDSKQLPFSKVNGKIFYKASDVDLILNTNYK